MPDSGKPRIRRWLAEPLVHFAVLGGLLFAIDGAVAREPDEPGHIGLSHELVESLRREHELRTGAPPTASEERALIEQAIDQEVLYREARALGLDRGDPVVRRRLIQKMTFVTEDRLEPPQPTSADLAAFAARHSDRYQRPARLTVRHVFLGYDVPDAQAQAWLAELRAGGEATGMGRPFVHGSRFVREAVRDIDGRLGPGVGERLLTVPVGIWSGPVESAYGRHLVLVEERLPAAVPALEDIEEAVRRDWLEQWRVAANREELAALRAHYTIELPPARPRAAIELASEGR